MDKTSYDVLNAVTLKKMADAATVTAVTDLTADVVETRLRSLSEQGLVVVAAGSALPNDGAEAALAQAADEQYAAVRSDADVSGLVDRFETTNTRFLTAMSSWQQVDVGGRKVTNDHSDAEYDAKVIDRIEKLVGRLRPLIDALAGHDARFANYGRRFSTALDAIDGGDHELVSAPRRDSVHNVWFEFHEDLLRTLGRERTE